LRQIGLALNAYVARHDVFPDGHGWNGFSLFVALLPDLEQRALFDSINISTPGLYVAPENTTAARTKVRAFVCPNDDGNTLRYLDVPPMNYAGNWGVGVQAFGYNGAFAASFQRSTRPAQIRDGSGTTAALSEWLVGRPDSPRDARRTVFRTPEEQTRPDQFEEFARSCQGLDPARAALGVPMSKGTNWLFGDFGFTMYNHTLRPNQRSCTNGTAFQQGAWTASSNHAGGVYVGMLDGSARFVKDSVGLATWRALGSRNGGEIIASGDF
jgi:hypothetical protein